MTEPYSPFERRALRELVALREQLDRLERTLVVGARRQGLSWREIGDDLGISLQSAWNRHASADPRRRPSTRRHSAEREIDEAAAERLAAKLARNRFSDA